jgi:type VI secretion system secreted protein VgrG
MINATKLFADLMLGRQYNRLLRLSFPNDDGPSSQLLLNRLDATEGLSRNFKFTVELLSDNPSLALKEMQGKLLVAELVRRDGSLRYFSGYVFSFRRTHADGGITHYEAELGPWLKFLDLRKDNYLFHGKNLREQAESIFSDFSYLPRWEWRVTMPDPAITDACQFDETDFNYLSRRWEAAGLCYWYEHAADGHTLVVSDDSTRAAEIDLDAEVRFQAAGGHEEEDGIDRWSPIRHIAPTSVGVTAFNFKHPIPAELNIPTLNQQGAVPNIDFNEYAGTYAFRDRQEGDALARLRMEEMEAASRYFDAEGNCRHLQPGRWFCLTDHFNHNPEVYTDQAGRDDFLILEIHHSATNNYLEREDENAGYRNRFTCIRKMIPWRPGRDFNSRQTKILAPQTATVVGPDGHSGVHTDEYGRVRVQFHWDRAGTRDERSSAWIRVAGAWAGAELGAAAIPRVGSEVLVQWLDGNPDRPIITGGVYNERNMPPWAVPGQHSITGLRSRELGPDIGNAAGGRGNHLVLDDTNASIQAQLKSDHACSQLSLGNITRIEDTSGRKDARGEGWEIATDAWGVARAGKGMLITTEARQNAASHIKDMGETVQRLAAAQDQHDALAGIAEQAQAQERQQQTRIAATLKTQNDAIAGRSTTTERGGFPELAAPHLVLSSPAGIAATTARSTHFASGESTALTAGESLSVAAGGGFFASIRDTFRLFVQKAGMKLVAAAGDIDVQALANSINLLSKLNITQTANRITITAKEEVVINGGGSYAVFGPNGIEHGTAGKFVTHAAMHVADGPNRRPPVLPDLPIVQVPAAYSQQLCVGKMLHTDPELKGATYEVWTKGDHPELLAQGILDDIGRSITVYTKEPTDIEIIFGENEWFDAVDLGPGPSADDIENIEGYA